MKCEHCSKVTATIHLTQVMDGEVHKHHLCEACAHALGFDVEQPTTITDFLLNSESESPPQEHGGPVCPICRTTRSRLKNKGRVGCATCYETFLDDLKPLVQAMHHGDLHVGKIPGSKTGRELLEPRVQRLTESLREAVEREAFEEAARLRDEIRKCRGSGAGEDAE